MRLKASAAAKPPFFPCSARRSVTRRLKFEDFAVFCVLKRIWVRDPHRRAQLALVLKQRGKFQLDEV